MNRCDDSSDQILGFRGPDEAPRLFVPPEQDGSQFLPEQGGARKVGRSRHVEPFELPRKSLGSCPGVALNGAGKTVSSPISSRERAQPDLVDFDSGGPNCGRVGE